MLNGLYRNFIRNPYLSKGLIALSLFYFGTLVLVCDAHAGSNPMAKKKGWVFSVGLTSMYKPAFMGSKDYQVIVLPDIKAEYGERFFASPYEGIGFNFLNSEDWKFGPLVKFDFGRTEEDDMPFRVAGKKSEGLKGMGDVDATLEWGGYLEYGYKFIAFKIEARQGEGGHKGFIGEAQLNLRGFLGSESRPKFIFMIGPHATFGDANYNQTFFGVNAQQSANSGLAEYKAEAGLVSYGGGVFFILPLSKNLAVNSMGSYDRLGKEAVESPLVKERGTEMQTSGMFGFSYDF